MRLADRDLQLLADDLSLNFVQSLGGKQSREEAMSICCFSTSDAPQVNRKRPRGRGNCQVRGLSTRVQRAIREQELACLYTDALQAKQNTFKEVRMNVTAQLSAEVILGAVNIADAVRTQLVERGRRNEEISLEWLPDPDTAPPPETPELRATLRACGSVRQMFSREELEVSCHRLDRPSVVAKINLVVESLQAGLP
jgi:hypothetical protein